MSSDKKKKSKKKRKENDENNQIETEKTERTKSSKRLQPDVLSQDTNEKENGHSRKKRHKKSKIVASSLPEESGSESDQREVAIPLKKKKKKKHKKKISESAENADDSQEESARRKKKRKQKDKSENENETEMENNGSARLSFAILKPPSRVIESDHESFTYPEDFHRAQKNKTRRTSDRNGIPASR